ncbi:MAG: hypothetical protein Q8Q35_04010 [Nanoarchaeota archaeon]|nr:hypothetical protein [Nanoarchaeota archaeon]
MKVLTLNTWLIPWAKDYRERRNNLVMFLKKEKFDVINLQEVWFNRDVRFIVKSLEKYGYTCSHTLIFNRTGLLTLYKGKKVREGVGYFSKIKKYTWKEKIIKRGFLHAKVKFKEGDLEIVNTHLINYELPWAKEENQRLFRKLQDYISSMSRVVMTGDFNLEIKDRDKVKKLNYIKTKVTWEKKNPYTNLKKDMKLDYIFYNELIPKSNKLVKELSDHNGISVTFR